MEEKGDGYVVASLGEESGYVPYTAFSAKKSYLEAHPEVIQAFTNALQRGMDFVADHSPEEISAVIKPQFPETADATLTTIVTRYHEQDSWKQDLIFSEDAFMLLQNILEEAGELKERVPYEELVDTGFAQKAAE
ncbi:MAG: ABC transporter substrate-binding protein [Lachnospiraceae bacterium]|nr:ABC transporter substrate-binding protein [Lachnospiraceae bacterium]